MPEVLDYVYQPGALDSDKVGYTGKNYRSQNMDEGPQQEMGERKLWRAFMGRKVDDARGIENTSFQWCEQCHRDDLTCGCRTVKLGRVVPVSPELAYMFIDGKHRQLISISAVTEIDGTRYWRMLRPQCTKQHTIQMCALNWIASKDCEDLCFEWDFNLKDYRRMVAGIKPKKHRPFHATGVVAA